MNRYSGAVLAAPCVAVGSLPFLWTRRSVLSVDDNVRKCILMGMLREAQNLIDMYTLKVVFVVFPSFYPYVIVYAWFYTIIMRLPTCLFHTSLQTRPINKWCSAADTVSVLVNDNCP
jgi:hypothetical protein